MPRGRAQSLIAAAALALTCGVATAVAAEPDRTLGAAGAPVTVEEYFSPTCPHCGHFRRETLAAVTAKYVDSGQVRFVFHEFPVHPEADTPVFLLAHCVGADGYWKVIDQVMAAPDANVFLKPSRRRVALLRIAGGLGLSPRAAAACLADSRGAKRIRDRFWGDTDDGGIDAAPTFVVNGVKMNNDKEPDLATFDAVFAPLLAAKVAQP